MRVSGLSGITFSEIMAFYPQHNRSVYEELKSACRRNGIIPFVGAGLSVFCGYQSWPDVLRQLAGYVYDPGVRADVEAMIQDGRLLQAAQEIQDNYPLVLKMLPNIIDYDKIRRCGPDRLSASAVFVLPHLFPRSLVMTTNFDRVLEEVYDRGHAKFGKVITPYEPDLLAQSRQNNPHCLFKLHGDIGPEIHDIDRLVFTQEQYDRAYSGGPLMQELPRWFESKKLLFLGCSLAQDRTMDVLQQVTSTNPGLDHYAILACRPEDVARRCIELGRWGISAIYYPDGRHEAVRVILERLLEDTDPSAYEALGRHSKKAVSTPKAANRFMYDSHYIPFVGRTQELEQLQAFCRDAGQISWWVVVGPGGMGKSRLLYEFTNSQRADGWEICWLKPGDYGHLSHQALPADRCIVVADDVQAHLQEIGNWIISISACRRSEKLRIILLERDGKSLNSARWAELLQSESPYDDTIPSRCYRSEFLNLAPLSDGELKDIMMDFAKASNRPLADSGHADRLLQALKKIDGELQRPIYALAVTDAWCSGKDPTRWSKEQVLDALVTREFKFYYDRLHSLSSDKISKVTRAELEYLLARSCVVPFLPLAQIADGECPRLRSRADKLDLPFLELLRQIGIVHNVTVRTQIKHGKSRAETLREDTMEAVVLDCPDLIKEYLVLRQALERNHLDLLLPEDWANDPLQLLFLGRLLMDYPEKLEEVSEFEAGFFAGSPEFQLPAQIYSQLLFAATIQLPNLKNQARDRLKRLHSQFRGSGDIAVNYARALFNLSNTQALAEQVISVEKLRQLHEQAPANEELAVVYAKGLFNLSEDQALEDRTRSVDKLRMLHEQIPENEELAAAYARGLFNLSSRQTLEERLRSVDKLRLLYADTPESEELAVAYARGLVNLSSEQELEDRTRSVDKLRQLYKDTSECKELAVAYASGLVNLSADQALGDLAYSVDKLRMLHEQIQANEELATAYARGLFNLSLEQTLENSMHSIDNLRLLHEQAPANKDLTDMYGKGLANLSAKQALEECLLSVGKLRQLYADTPESEELAIHYAHGLINLSFRQTEEADVQENVRQSANLLSKYQNSPEIQLAYAETMFNLTLTQKPEALCRTVAQLREFLLAHPEANPEFQNALDTYLNEHPDHTERYALLRV